MCPALAVTTSAFNGLGMGLSTTVVLIMATIVISLIANKIPDKIRIPCYIVVIATFVSAVDMLMSAYVNTPGPQGEPSLYDQLGIFIPLIVVNCIVLGRAEAFASKNNLIPSILDGAGAGLGFTLGLVLLGGTRELLGNGTIFGFGQALLPDTVDLKMIMFVLSPGAFIVLGYLIAIINKLASKS
jgi:electron transport complex protein RnfE